MSLREFWAQFARTLPYFKGLHWVALLVLFCVVLAAVTEPFIPALLKPVLDNGFSGENFKLWYVPVGLVGVFTVRSMSNFLSEYGLAYISQKGLARMRQSLFSRLQHVSPTALEASSSQLSNIVVHEMQNGMRTLIKSLIRVLQDGLTLIALLGYLLYLNWMLTLLVLTMFPVVAGIMHFFAQRLHKTVKSSQLATDELAYVVEENVLAWRSVRLHAAQTQQEQRFNRLSERLRVLMVKTTLNDALTSPLTQIISAFALSGVITLALWQSQHQGGTVGGFVAFVTAMLLLLAPLKRSADIFGSIVQGLTALMRGMDMLENTPLEPSGSHQQAQVRGDLRFEAVSLHYPQAESPALSHIDLQVQPGETIALVGSSGAGKTTLMNLLPRFLEPSTGRILLDGIALPEWDTGNLRQHLAFVSQDVVLLNTSLAANIAMSDEPDEARVQAALKAAHLEEFVASLPQGIHHPVGHNGKQLSGGQRQRVAIARALYKNAPILLLDEATSALDTQSEKAVQAALKTLMQGRTTLIIAHRLSTIEHADRILVMQQGRIVEEGRHADLLAAGGVYATLQHMAQAQQV